MATNPVVLILGAGPRIGAAVAEKFASIGFSVAMTSRSGTGTKNDKGYLSLKADFTKPESIPALFDAVQNEFGTAPNVVIHNAAALANPPEKDSVLSLSAENLMLDMNVNTISPYIAAQEAVKGWESLAKDVKKTFIYTGNIQNVAVVPVPIFLTLGMGKSASAYFVGTADTLYSDKGYRYVTASGFMKLTDTRNIASSMPTRGR